MANPNFEISTITAAGAAMLAQATEGNKVIFSGCEANSTVYTLEQAKAVAAVTGTRITDGIEVTGVTDARILVRATFEPSSATGGEANSLILFGRLSSQDESTRTPICVVSNSTPFYLPEYNQAAVSAFDCLFTVQYNISSPVVVEQTSALECSLAEFRQLKERVVTTHKSGEETSGDDQDVYGVKSFWSGIKFKEYGFDDQTASADANGFKIENTEMNFGFEASYGQDIVINSNSSVSTHFKVKDETLAFGKYSNYGANPFFSLDYSGDSGTVFMGIAPNDDGSYPVSIVKGSLSDGVYLAADYAKLKKLSVSGKVSGTLYTADILPDENNNRTIGTNAMRWNSLYVTNIDASGPVGFSGTLTLGGNVASNIIPNEDGLYSLGRTTDKWKSVYADWIHADTKLLAYDLKVENEVSMPDAACAGIVSSGITRGAYVGMIQFVVFENYTGAISAGDTLDNTKFKFVTLSVGSDGGLIIAAGERASFGTWKAITYGGKIDTTGNFLILAIRTA